MIGLSRTAIQQRITGRRVIASTTVTATTPLVETLPLALDPQTDSITVRLKRPTSTKSLNWDATGVVTVTIKAIVDGVPHITTGRATGGIRLDHLGQEMPEYSLTLYPTWGYFNGPSQPPTRLGEGHSTYRAVVEIARSTGEIETELDITTTASPAPDIPFTNSVAYDAATGAKESGGDGTLSIAHSPTGSTDLAAFFATSMAGSGTATETGTVDASATNVNELWELNYAGYIHHAAYTKTGIGTGSKTYEIVSTDSAPGTQFIGVVTFTGVHQTPGSEYTGVNTATGSTTSPSATATSVTSDDMVVDCLGSYFGGDPSIGADQTARQTQNEGADYWFECSTQPGSAGGAMTWTLTGSPDWALGAVTIKASAGGGGAKKRILPGLLIQRAISMRP